MDNNVIISAWLNVPKAAEKLKKTALKGADFIQFAPARAEAVESMQAASRPRSTASRRARRGRG